MGEKITVAITMSVLVVVIPYILTMTINGRNVESGVQIKQIDTGRDVLIQIDGSNQLIDVEEYIAGILPGIAEYSSDVTYLEAQAVAVRTKIYFAMKENTIINASELDYEYYSEEEYLKKWGEKNYKQIKNKYDTAVINTARQIIE